MNIVRKEKKRIKQKNRVQFKLKNINIYNDKLRISVFISGLHSNAQVISSDGKVTLSYVSTQQKWFKEENNKTAELKSYNVKGSTRLGEKLGEILKKDFSKESFYFDRGGKKYTGRIKAIADGIRSQGIVL